DVRGWRRRADQKVKVMTIVDELCEGGIHAHPHGRKQLRDYVLLRANDSNNSPHVQLNIRSFLLEFPPPEGFVPAQPALDSLCSGSVRGCAAEQKESKC